MRVCAWLYARVEDNKHNRAAAQRSRQFATAACCLRMRSAHRANAQNFARKKACFTHFFVTEVQGIALSICLTVKNRLFLCRI